MADIGLGNERADSNLTMSLSPFMDAFGMPPSSYVSDDMIRNSMPIIEFWPAEPHFATGLSLFTLDESKGKTAYLKILKNLGFATTIPIRAAFIADNFPTDTFSNEYTETFLQKFTDVASSALSQIVQLSGQKNASNAFIEYGTEVAKVGESMGGTMGGVLKSGAEAGVNMAQNLNKYLEGSGADDGAMGKMLRGGSGLVNKMLAGHRIDFPQIWSNSGFTPSYSVTIRLFNPLPGSTQSTKRFIAGPIACFLALATPRTDNGNSYRWPFYQRIKVAGLYELAPAAITNITIVKGGDQQQIAFNQNLGICDVRIDFQALHRSMLLEEEPSGKFDQRPTVRKYIDELTTHQGSTFVRRDKMNENISKIVGVSSSPAVSFPDERESFQVQKNKASQARQIQVATLEPVGYRTSLGDKKKQRALENQSDKNFVSPRIPGTSLINIPPILEQIVSEG